MNWRLNRKWWNFLTPNTIASASLSSSEYVFSVTVSDLDASAIGFSALSSMRCDKMAPTPYGDASHERFTVGIEVDQQARRRGLRLCLLKCFRLLLSPCPDALLLQQSAERLKDTGKTGQELRIVIDHPFRNSNDMSRPSARHREIKARIAV